MHRVSIFAITVGFVMLLAVLLWVFFSYPGVV
jgi:hypothetical protein